MVRTYITIPLVMLATRYIGVLSCPALLPGTQTAAQKSTPMHLVANITKSLVYIFRPLGPFGFWGAPGGHFGGPGGGLAGGLGAGGAKTKGRPPFWLA